MKLWRLRRSAYRASPGILGDVQAIERGPAAIVTRAERKWIWRTIARMLRKGVECDGQSNENPRLRNIHWRDA
jgi:hypothetical protein